MSARARRVREHAGGLDYDFRPQFAPRQLGRIALGENAYLVAVYAYAVRGRFDLARIPAIGGVVLEQSGAVFGFAEIVDRHDLERLRVSLAHRAERLPPNPSKAVDSDSGRHARAS